MKLPVPLTTFPHINRCSNASAAAVFWSGDMPASCADSPAADGIESANEEHCTTVDEEQR